MSPSKVRLDLMVSEHSKEFLQEFAKENGVSMSEMVDRLIVEHLMNESREEESVRELAQSTFDAARLEDLKAMIAEGVASGKICSFDQYCQTEKSGPGENSGSVIFTPSRWSYYGDIVADFCVDEIHDDIISTYSDVFSTVDVYLAWFLDTDGPHLGGLTAVPKGGNPTRGYSYDWFPEAEWPEGVPEPQCPGGSD